MSSVYKDFEYNCVWSEEENRLIEWYEHKFNGKCFDSVCDKQEYNDIRYSIVTDEYLL